MTHMQHGFGTPGMSKLGGMRSDAECFLHARECHGCSSRGSVPARPGVSWLLCGRLRRRCSRFGFVGLGLAMVASLRLWSFIITALVMVVLLHLHEVAAEVLHFQVVQSFSLLVRVNDSVANGCVCAVVACYPDCVPLVSGKEPKPSPWMRLVVGRVIDEALPRTLRSAS